MFVVCLTKRVHTYSSYASIREQHSNAETCINNAPSNTQRPTSNIQYQKKGRLLLRCMYCWFPHVKVMFTVACVELFACHFLSCIVQLSCFESSAMRVLEPKCVHSKPTEPEHSIFVIHTECLTVEQ